jgi:diketogulonate reductase-like aldo/keto reductase
MITELCGKRVYPIGFGTWRMGGEMNASNTNDDKEIKAIKYAIDNGINVIDTAEMYGAGHAEELVAYAIKRRDREKLFIVSKVWPTNLSHDKLIRSAENSLRRLGSKYIDLYLIHWPNPLANMKEAIGAMEELIDKGVIRHMGVSNFGVNDVRKAMEAAKKYEIAANEISYSLAKKDSEDYLIPFCQKHKIKIIAHTPLARGNVLKMREVVELAEKYRRKPSQIALNYLMKKSLPIPKAVNTKHIKEIIGAVGWGMDEADYNRLSEMR